MMISDQDALTYNVKAVVRATGLTPDTLRAWERRYGIPHPQRSGGGHRLYSQRDVDTLKWLVSRQRDGMSISRAVALWHQLAKEGQDPLHTARAGSASLVVGADRVDELRREWVDACLAFDEQRAEEVLTEAFAIHRPETVCLDIIQEGMAAIGEAWQSGEATVQQEHFASELAMRRLERLMASAPPPVRPGRILTACPAGEQHDFPMLLLALLLRWRGWEVVHLGPNSPLDPSHEVVSRIQPDIVVLSAQQLCTAGNLLEATWKLNETGVPVAYGGRIFNRLPAMRARVPGHFLGERLEDAPNVAETLLVNPPARPSVEMPPAEYREAVGHFRQQRWLLEAQVWQALQEKGMPDSHLSAANENMACGIIAALTFGDLNLMDDAVGWAQDTISSRPLNRRIWQEYFVAYNKAAVAALDQRGQPVIDWLARHAETSD